MERNILLLSHTFQSRDATSHLYRLKETTGVNRPARSLSAPQRAIDRSHLAHALVDATPSGTFCDVRQVPPNGAPQLSASKRIPRRNRSSFRSSSVRVTPECAWQARAMLRRRGPSGLSEIFPLTLVDIAEQVSEPRSDHFPSLKYSWSRAWSSEGSRRT